MHPLITMVNHMDIFKFMENLINLLMSHQLDNKNKAYNSLLYSH